MPKTGRKHAELIEPGDASLEAVGTMSTAVVEGKPRQAGWWKVLLDHMPVYVVTVGPDRRISYLNRRPSGQPVTEVVGRKVESLAPPEYRDVVVSVIDEVFRTGQGANREMEARGPSGTVAWYRSTVTPLIHDGKVVEVIIVSLDITDERRTAEELRLSEMRYQDLFEDAPDMYFTVAQDGTIVNVNQFGAASLGYEKSQLIGAEVWVVVHPEDRERISNQVAHIFNERVVRSELEFRKVRKDGSVLWVRERGRLVVKDGDELELRIVCRDITQRKLVEQALAESEERHRLTLDAVSGGGRDWNIATGEVLYSNRWIEGLGYNRGEITPDISFWEDLIHPDDRARVMRALEAHLEGKTPFYECENRLRTRSGEYRWHLDRGKVVAREPDGRPLRMVGTDTDITERKRAESALRESRNSLTEAQRITHIGNWEWNLDRDDVYWSEELYRIFDIPANVPPTFGMYVKRVHPDDRQAFREAMERTRRAGEACEIEHRIQLPDGSIRHIHAEGSLVRGDQGEPVRLIGTAQDITDRKRAEDRLTASLREKDLLLREVHHRVKNNLQVISSLLSLHARHLDDVKVKNALYQTQSRVRAIGLVHETLHQTEDLGEIDAKKYIERLIAHLHTAFVDSNQVSITTQLDRIPISIDRCISCGLIINELVSNAIQHGFPDGRPGEIRVELRANLPTGYELSVSDNGTGLPASLDIDHPDSLGLELVRMFCEQLGGSLGIDSGEGARFEVCFPAEASQ